jgi:hypothetical protein
MERYIWPYGHYVVVSHEVERGRSAWFAVGLGLILVGVIGLIVGALGAMHIFPISDVGDGALIGITGCVAGSGVAIVPTAPMTYSAGDLNGVAYESDEPRGTPDKQTEWEAVERDWYDC